MKLKVSSITGIGKECKILMVHLLSMEIILFSLLFASYCSSVVNSACQEQILPYSSNKDLSVIKTSLFYLSLFIFFIILFFFLKSGQNATKFAIDTNFVTYCLNYFVSGMPFEGLPNFNVSESVKKRNMAQLF